MNIFQDWFQGIAITITSFFIVVTSILPWSTTGINKPNDTSIATSSATASESASPSPSITPTITPKPKIKLESTPAPTPVVTETQSNELPQIKGIQKPKIDSAIGIEQCKTYAKEKRKDEERKVNEQYARSEPKIVELAASQNNGQTQAIALKYGDISQEYINKVLGTYDQAIKEGNASEVATQKAQAALSDFSGYLRDLHNWGKTALNNWNTVLKDKFDTYENQVYQACLSIL